MTRAQRTFSSLAVPAFRRYFIGHVASILGFWIRITAQGWLVWKLTDSKEALGLVTAVGLAPFAFLSLLGGILGDRLDRRVFLATVPLVSVAANIVLGVLVLSDSIEIWHIYVTAFLIGSARALEIPIRNAFVRDLAGLDHLQNAVALNAAGFNASRVMGPALAAPLLPLIGIGGCFLVAAALNLSMTIALAGLRLEVGEHAAPQGNGWQQLLEGVRYVRGHHRTRTLLLLLAIVLVFGFAYQTLMPAYADEGLGLGEEGYATLMATIGVGALLGALWVAGRASLGRHRRGVVFGLVWGGALAIFTLGFIKEPALAYPFLVLAGFCQVGFIATANGMVQESVPDAIRGRVMGLWAFTFGVFFPVGSLLMGFVSQHMGLDRTWSGGAVVVLALSAVVWLLLPKPVQSEAEVLEERAARARLDAEAGPGVSGPGA